ncbi:50S ribosomal protein L21 [Patescibacteria group bacterium]|nr:50S ribosomal protein L21 [Patescibacteria group bacterium]
MKYAVLAISGSQYLVSEGQTLTIDKQAVKEGENQESDQVLLFVDGNKTEIGNPLVKNAVVSYQIIKQHQGEKIRVFKYKAKSRYRKTQGFRAQQTDIKIDKISLKSTSKPKTKTKKLEISAKG